MEPNDYGIHNLLKQFAAGEAPRAYTYMGCHRQKRGGEDGFVFRVWAPNARAISVVGDWNFWNTEDLPMVPLEYGVWEAFSPVAEEGQSYKFYVQGSDGQAVYKRDPYSFAGNGLPDTSGRICSLDRFTWSDGEYRRRQGKQKLLDCPMNIYEVHFGSWKKKEDGSYFSYEEMAAELVPYVKEMGYTHIELMPMMEHPYEPSWGYQVTGYYSPTARYGDPFGFMKFIDICHQEGIGVLLDWVPAHFPKDDYGLYEFDGGCCYELSDSLMNEHPHWKTRIFDLGRGEVQSFLISNAVFWLEQYHIDGIRVDAVSSMLYLDFGRWEYRPNRYGGKENLAAIAFLRKLNRALFAARRNAIPCAEESTAFPLVTKPDYDGGLGFLFKWNMGWMNDMLRYMALDPLWRKGSHNLLTFSMTYAFSENYILPLSHDEVVYEKKSLVEKMPGSYDDKFANLRTLFGFMMGHPGKKLSFMGNEIAQFAEWDYKTQINWQLLDFERHRQMQEYVRDLNHFYLENSPLWNNDGDWNGFQWISPDDRDHSVIAFRRIDRRGRELIVVCNFCPVERQNYRIGLPRAGVYDAVFQSDAVQYGGRGTVLPPVTAEKIPLHGLPFSGGLTLAPLSVAFYKRRSTPRNKMIMKENEG